MSAKKTFRTEIEPRFCETDALGHIGNTTLPVWLEHARGPIFSALHPSMSIDGWPMIVAHVSIDYLGQIFVQDLVSVETIISKVGNKSFTVQQKVFQKNKHVASGETVIVYFDYKTEKTISIPDKQREILQTLNGH